MKQSVHKLQHIEMRYYRFNRYVVKTVILYRYRGEKVTIKMMVSLETPSQVKTLKTKILKYLGQENFISNVEHKMLKRKTKI